MELIIKNPNNEDLRGFISSFLLLKIKEYFIEILNPQNLIPIEDYINSPDILKTIALNPEDNIYINLKALSIVAISSLVSNRIDNDYLISINSEKIIPKLTAKLIDIVKLINYGSMNSPAYPIFTKTFDHIASKLPLLYKEYIDNYVT